MDITLLEDHIMIGDECHPAGAVVTVEPEEGFFHVAAGEASFVDPLDTSAYELLGSLAGKQPFEQHALLVAAFKPPEPPPARRKFGHGD